MRYEKINTIWKRDTENKDVIMPNEFSMEEFDNVLMWSVSEKVDGQCITVLITKDEIKTIGKSEKTVFNKAHNELLAYINSKITRETVDKIFDFDKADTITLYGEGYGPGIQSGGKYRDDQSFILFDVKIDDIWIKEEDVTRFSEELGIDRVPLLGNMVWEDVVQFIQDRPISRIGKSPMMEGVVCRSEPLVLDRFGRRIIWKLKVKDYEQLDRSRNKNV